MICAAIPAHNADAALVALLVVNKRSNGWLWVVNKFRLAMPTAPSSSLAALPPSSTTSGFKGHARSYVLVVVVKGLRPPASATGFKEG